MNKLLKTYLLLLIVTLSLVFIVHSDASSVGFTSHMVDKDVVIDKGLIPVKDAPKFSYNEKEYKDGSIKVCVGIDKVRMVSFYPLKIEQVSIGCVVVKDQNLVTAAEVGIITKYLVSLKEKVVHLPLPKPELTKETSGNVVFK